MTSIVHAGIEIQLSPEVKAAVPPWFEEVLVMASYLKEHQVLASLAEHVRFARARMGRYDLIDFVVVLLGYGLSGERTIHDFYQRLQPYGELFMGLFGRARLPHRSTLSRFLAALTSECVEQLRQQLLGDLAARPWPQQEEAGCWDRTGQPWRLFDVDGTRAVARQRALPQTSDLPPAHRRHEQVCAKGYTGRKRGEVVRTRTTVLQLATGQWLGTFSGAGNGSVMDDLRRALQAILTSTTMRSVSPCAVLVRLDGLYGSGVYVATLQQAQLAFVLRGKDYGVLQQPEMQARLALPADATLTHAESGLTRSLSDCAAVRLPNGAVCRVIIATHAARATKPAVGVSREGVVHELFYTALPQEGFLARDVVDLYLHRGAFEQVLADEDQEQDPDRWCSHTPCGQEFWQLLAQWGWNLRLELGHLSQPSPLRTTLLAPAVELEPTPSPPEPSPSGERVIPSGRGLSSPHPHEAAVSVPPPALLLAPSAVPRQEANRPLALSEPPSEIPALPPVQWARAARPGLFAGAAFTRQADGTLRCPTGSPLTLRERRPASHDRMRLLYMASASHCGPCPYREQCLRNGPATATPRRVSLLIATSSLPAPGPSLPSILPLAPPPSPPGVPALALPQPAGSHPLLLKDWQRLAPRRHWMRLMRTHSVEIEELARAETAPAEGPPTEAHWLTRAQRAHWRLSWAQRLARNAAVGESPRWRLRLGGLPPGLAQRLQVSG